MVKKFFLSRVVLPLLLPVEIFAAEGAYAVNEVPENHYDISWSKDMPVTFFAAFASAFGNYRYSQMERLESEDYRKVSELAPWDRPVAGR